MDELEKAYKELKAAVWKERRGLVVLVLTVESFLSGVVIEHYWPGILTRLWM